jgi:hypothetical protein
MNLGVFRYGKFLRFVLTALAIMAFSSPAVTQQPVGSISGIVTDPHGGAIPGATVTVTSVGTGATRVVQTNESGFYLVSTLLPGEYKLTVNYSGFANYELDRVVVEVGQIARVNPSLQVAAARETVEVTSATAFVDTTQNTVGGVINARQIEQLPLNGRNYLELARLQPGIEIQEGTAFDPTKTRYTGISIGGRLGREARITIDGVDAVDEHVGTTTINISQDSIREFQLSSSSADSSTGLSATGAVNVITRRGSNEIHGSGFAFGRSSSFAARPGLGPSKPDFDREQWGFNAGGPFVKDQLFWFANFEQTRENSSISINTPYFPNLTSFPAPFNERSSTVRLDWRMPHQTDAFLRWSRNDNSNFGNFGGNKLPSTGNINTNTAHQFALGLDTPITSRLTNGFRSAVTDFKNRVLRPPADANPSIVPGTDGFRIVTDDGLLIAGPDNITPQSTFERFYQFRDDLTYTRGNHTWRAGIDVVYRRVFVTNFVFGFPSLTVVSPASKNPADILNAKLVDFNIGNRNGKRIPGTPDNTHRNTRISWYAADSWRMRRNFTLNLGLRYEVDTHPLNNDLPKPAAAAPLLPDGTAPTPIKKKNFAPQIGFAWDPFKNGKTSIRAGFGIFYALPISNLVTNERATLAPFNSGNDTIRVTANSNLIADFDKDGIPDFDFTSVFGPTGTVQTALSVIAAGQQVFVKAPSLSVPALQITGNGLLITNKFTTPYSQQANIGVQREFPWNSIVDVNFLYSRTVHEVMRDLDAANIFPGNGTRIPLPGVTAGQITLDRFEGFSRYRALTVRFDKRYSKRYQFTASYALSRFETTLPDGLGLGGGTLVNRNVQANFGPGALDRTHRLSFNVIADLPLGFRVSMISSWMTGLPTTAIDGSADLNGDGINGALLPGTHRGSLGRDVDSPAKLNALIRNYNLTLAGKPLPRPGRAPFVLEVPDSIKFGDSFISHDLQITKIFRVTERFKIEATAQVFNLFNISNLVGPGGLPASAFNGTLTTVASTSAGAPSGFKLGADGSLLNAAGNRALAGLDAKSGFASLGTTRPSISTGTGLPRAFQFGLRVNF